VTSDADFTGFGDLINEIAIEFNSRFKELLILKNDVLLFNNLLAVPIESQNIKYRIELCNLRADPYLSIKKETGIDFFKLLSKCIVYIPSFEFSVLKWLQCLALVIHVKVLFL